MIFLYNDLITTNDRIIKYDSGIDREYVGIYIFNGNRYMVFAPWDVKNKGVPTVFSLIIDNAQVVTTNIEANAWSPSSNAILIYSSDMEASSGYIGRFCRFTVTAI